MSMTSRFSRQSASLGKSGVHCVVELEAYRQLRRKVNRLLYLALTNSVTTSEMHQQLRLGVAEFGTHLARQLVHSLQRENQEERQALVWLLTLLNEPESIPLLQQMSLNHQLPSTVRLSASFALAGMGATREVYEPSRGRRLYAIS